MRNPRVYVPSKSLTLPEGYQRFNGCNLLPNKYGLSRNSPERLKDTLDDVVLNELYLFTHHQIFWNPELGLIQQTRSSPNWEGGMFTFATCKHQMRTWKKDPTDWIGTWLAGLGPKECQDNTLIYAGQISEVFTSNYAYGKWLKQEHPSLVPFKSAMHNPRGDRYTPIQTLHFRGSNEIYNHESFVFPKGHTRSVETYKDGSPKWWRDIEYTSHGRRPPIFVLSPVCVFSKPLLWTSLNPGRACLKIDCGKFLDSLLLARS